MINTQAVEHKKWAVYSYIQANNNLSSVLPSDFDINYKNINAKDAYVAAMVSYPERLEMYHSKIITKLYEMKDGKKKEKADLPYQNMSSPKTLKEFLIWAMTNYPAEKSIVVFADHGEGWVGTLIDETSGKLIDPSELKNALEEAYIATGKRPDIIAFDSCFMANMETAYELAGKAKLMIGSEEYTSANMPKTKAFSSISDSSGGATPLKVAEEWVKQSYKRAYGPMVSAVNLDEVKELGKAISELAEVLIGFIKKGDDSKKKIKKIIEKSCRFGGVINRQEFFGNFVDLKSFVKNLLKDDSVDKKIKDTAEKLEAQIDKTVIFSTSKYFNSADFSDYNNPEEIKQIKEAESLSIYMPTTKKAAVEPWKLYLEKRNSSLDEDISYKNLQFAKDTQWDEFFELLNS